MTIFALTIFSCRSNNKAGETMGQRKLINQWSNVQVSAPDVNDAMVFNYAHEQWYLFIGLLQF